MAKTFEEKRLEAYKKAQQKAEKAFPEADTAAFNYRLQNMGIEDKRKDYVRGYMQSWEDHYDMMNYV